MALTERRPIAIPVTAAPSSPSFNAAALNIVESRKNSIAAHLTKNSLPDVLENEAEDEEADDEDELLSPQPSLHEDESPSPPRSVSPDSLMNDADEEVNTKTSSRETTPPTTTSTPPSTQNDSDSPPGKVKKPKNTSRAPIATGVSTNIPVTGEKPRPQQTNDPSLEDDVLFAIFIILYEKDAEGAGMTVKQICDILIEQHPEMANLSTKTSNLVSAKLNAYVKRVEKGDISLKYALSRDWADASPKRMVYVYRGILADDFHVHAKKLMEEQKRKQQESASAEESSSTPESESPKSGGYKLNKAELVKLEDDEDSFEIGKQALGKPRRQTMFDLGVTKNTFLDSPIEKCNLFVPYSSAPVAASLAEAVPIDNNEEEEDDNKDVSDFEFDFEVFADSDEEDNMIETLHRNGKRSKSMSYLSFTHKNNHNNSSNANKKTKILTAAAAAPRASRAPSSHSVNAAAAAAALHAAALQAISNPPSTAGSLDKGSEGYSANRKWLNVIRSGFMTQDIATPEDVSLSDLDKFFS
ncbi:Protein GDS1 [Spathaspora sp. JA1]|nr:Protein GDS1 [Spathaspora sp. JA1]